MENQDYIRGYKDGMKESEYFLQFCHCEGRNISGTYKICIYCGKPFKDSKPDNEKRYE